MTKPDEQDTEDKLRERIMESPEILDEIRDRLENDEIVD